MAASWQLPGVLVVVFIALGVLAFLLLFVLSKRQFQRITQRGQKGPHYPVGHRANKALRRQIEWKMERCRELHTVPSLLSPSLQSNHANFHRIMALELAKLLEAEVSACAGVWRHRDESLRRHIVALRPLVLAAVPARTVHEYCDLYEGARHSPHPFQQPALAHISRLHHQILDSLCTSRQREPLSALSSPAPEASPYGRPKSLSLRCGGQRETRL